MSAIRLKAVRLTTAIIGVGSIGRPLARHLVGSGEVVVLAAKDQSRAQALADELGPLARAASVEDATAGADAAVFAVWLDKFCSECSAPDPSVISCTPPAWSTPLFPRLSA